MKHISILIPENAMLASLEGTRILFAEVNEYLKAKGLTPAFNIQLVGLTDKIFLGRGRFVVNADACIENIKKTDLIIIPSIEGDIAAALGKNKDFIPWINRQYKNGSEIASLCLGAFLLARTGLLNRRKCATHWRAENLFRHMFPEVELVTENILTDEHRIYSSGGAYSYLNLILYLIEKYTGREVAVYAAKIFAIEIDRGSQLPFTVFHGQKEHNDFQIKQAQEFIERNYHDKITVGQLAAMHAIGRRNFERRFKKATSNTPIEYMQRVKVEIIKKKLETENMNINELMYSVGYSDKKAFRNIFKKRTGLSPVEYKKIYHNEKMLHKPTMYAIPD